MHKKTTTFSLLFSLGALLVSSHSLAQGRLMADVGPCLSLETAVERYACYEKQASAALAGGLSGSAPAPAAPAAPRQPSGSSAPAPDLSVSTTQSSAADSFGFEQSTPAKPPEQKANPDGPVDELNSVIASLDTIKPNQYTITLENGQVWRQSRPDSRMRLKAGQHVRIYPTRWGNDYRMSVEELKGYVQVSRIK